MSLSRALAAGLAELRIFVPESSQLKLVSI